MAGPKWHQAPVKLNRFQRERVRSLLAGREIAHAQAAMDTLRLVAIQVQFADSLMGGQPGSRRPQLRDSLFFANELEHLTDYYRGASRNYLTVAWEVTSRLYTLPKAMGYYGKDGEEETRVVEMVQTVIDSADDDVDFSLFDAVVVIHAGAGQETDLADDSREQIWSSFYDLDDIDHAFPDSTVSGLATNDSLGGMPFFVDNFLALPANASQDGVIIATLGIWAFETGSRLGLLPLFDSTPAGFPDSRGVGSFCLMSYGLFNTASFIPGFPCAFNRILGGWLDPVFVESGGHFRLRDINSPANGDTACLKIPVTESEYFLVVNRVHDTNFDSLFTFGDLDSNLVPDNPDSLLGAEFDFFLTDVTNPQVIKRDPDFKNMFRRYVSTGSGIYVWHIDEMVIREALETGFLPNDFVSRKSVDLEEADGVQDLDGVADQSFSFGSHWDSFRAGHIDHFSPDTDPASNAHSGARTGIRVSGITSPAPYMECDVSFSLPYSERRIRWEATAPGQPPTPVNLDGGDSTEVVILADTGLVYVFKADGSEYVDQDADPQTIEPFLTVPGAVWTGPPAFGDIDGDLDLEIVASSKDGRLFAWHDDGSEVFDGDGNPSTEGVLYAGSTMVAPPLLYDIISGTANRIAIIEREGDSLAVSFIDDTGNKVFPFIWPGSEPAKFQAQFASAPAVANIGVPNLVHANLAVAWADTVDGVYGISFLPLELQPAESSVGEHSVFGSAFELLPAVTFPLPEGIDVEEMIFSPVAAGDLDADTFDEVVLALPNGELVTYSYGAFARGREPLSIAALRGNNPSAPALGDVDNDGTLEIALWDDDFFYLFKHNGALYTNWPKPALSVEFLDLPPLSFDNLHKSPLIGDINGDGAVEILFPTSQGAVRAFHNDGSTVAGFPRPAPALLDATPSLSDIDGDGEVSLLAVGTLAALEGRDGVRDTLITSNVAILSVQSFPGSQATDDQFWAMYQNSVDRRGRTRALEPLQQSPALVEAGSFMIYPNPVTGAEVRVRVTLNQSATVGVEIYNLEGERAFSHEFAANPSGVIQTPFDEALDVSSLKSGIYFLRLSVSGSSESTAEVKPFAIKR
ncbi:MAG: T9SS type A sorting domain-containing protein [Candidatus Latescibacteria bacterium]|nr:T9SS type A sorting domain-containing protein [Candidatus Latescibacterota bacterium]NIM64569.1 T9SS type A sorting domain-containing protein [Candidatus Latescibacterota bacterium]NIO27477.1 T9SS type A sorting domain-containing protein [Candidatus Latescibacterota bacterium]NIO54999.1 T9SS type A sorting domain-containing protein [Candidatus Latescibacterota bacterium]NIT01097.1 T9SS type A sorting domain-containing protein [Candidatus Latescibacterota bacterium]